MSRIAFSALSFFLVIIVPLQGNDEPNVSLIQTACLVRLLLTAHTLNKSTSITPFSLLPSIGRRRVTRGSFLDANTRA
jgi:hypothetical protein